jgi:hypothetical protein
MQPAVSLWVEVKYFMRQGEYNLSTLTIQCPVTPAISARFTFAQIYYRGGIYEFANCRIEDTILQ